MITKPNPTGQYSTGQAVKYERFNQYKLTISPPVFGLLLNEYNPKSVISVRFISLVSIASLSHISVLEFMHKIWHWELVTWRWSQLMPLV